MGVNSKPIGIGYNITPDKSIKTESRKSQINLLCSFGFEFSLVRVHPQKALDDESSFLK